MRDSIAVRKWLDIAVSGVKFAPDQETVKAELMEHIEDKTADLMRIFPGMTEKEAQERALAGMGDAWELKDSLAKVHRPWLGWLWTLTRLLVWAALAMGLLIGTARVLNEFQGENIPWWLNSRVTERTQRAVTRALYEDGEPTWEGEQLSVFEPGAQVRLDRAVLSVPRAAWWREEGKDRLYLQVLVTWDRPWEAHSYVHLYLWAEDDLGNRYWQEDHSIPARGWGERGIRTDYMNVYLDPPPEAQEVHIHHKLRDGVDLVVELPEEVRP